MVHKCLYYNASVDLMFMFVFLFTIPVSCLSCGTEQIILGTEESEG